MALTNKTKLVVTAKGIKRAGQANITKTVLYPSSQRPRWILQYIRERGSRGVTMQTIIGNSHEFLTGFEVKSGWGDPRSKYGVELAQEAVMKALKKLVRDKYVRVAQ